MSNSLRHELHKVGAEEALANVQALFPEEFKRFVDTDMRDRLREYEEFFAQLRELIHPLTALAPPTVTSGGAPFLYTLPQGLVNTAEVLHAVQVYLFDDPRARALHARVLIGNRGEQVEVPERELYYVTDYSLSLPAVRERMARSIMRALMRLLARVGPRHGQTEPENQ